MKNPISYLEIAGILAALAGASAISWSALNSSRTTMESGRVFLGVAAVDDKIYAIGGSLDRTHHTSLVEEFDPDTGIWNTKAPMPSSRNAIGICVWNGKIVVAGGNDPKGPVEIYDPGLDVWKSCLPMPNPRGQLGLSNLGNEILVSGGFGNQTDYLFEAYDPSHDQWTRRPNLQKGKTNPCNGGAVTVKGKLYLIGGKEPGGTTAIDEYDPVAKSWQAKASMPSSRWDFAAAVMADKIYVLGGLGDTDQGRRVEVFDPQTNQWRRAKDLSEPRWWGGAAAVNGKIYLVGGASGDGFPTRAQVYVP